VFCVDDVFGCIWLHRLGGGGGNWVRFAPARGPGALWRGLGRGVRQNGTWLRFAESRARGAVAFSRIRILRVAAGIGSWMKRVETGMAASPFCRRAVQARRFGLS
jgi:hypothetical protein